MSLKCVTKFCSGLRQVHNNYCRKCQWRRLKERDPLLYSFYHLNERRAA
jgi:hypothetical protein